MVSGAVVELTLVLRVSTLRALYDTAAVAATRITDSAASRRDRPECRGGPGRAGVGHGGEVAVSRGESRTRPRLVTPGHGDGR